jgi:hypothetical protein
MKKGRETIYDRINISESGRDIIVVSLSALAFAFILFAIFSSI